MVSLVLNEGLQMYLYKDNNFVEVLDHKVARIAELKAQGWAETLVQVIEEPVIEAEVIVEETATAPTKRGPKPVGTSK